MELQQNFLNGPTHTSIILYHVLLQSRILSINDYKTRTSVNSKSVEDLSFYVKINKHSISLAYKFPSVFNK